MLCAFARWNYFYYGEHLTGGYTLDYIDKFEQQDG